MQAGKFIEHIAELPSSTYASFRAVWNTTFANNTTSAAELGYLVSRHMIEARAPADAAHAGGKAGGAAGLPVVATGIGAIVNVRTLIRPV
jgi:hypothetical protein